MESSFQFLSIIEQNEINSDDFYYTTFHFRKFTFLYYVFNNGLKSVLFIFLVKYFSLHIILISSLLLTNVKLTQIKWDLTFQKQRKSLFPLIT